MIIDNIIPDDIPIPFPDNSYRLQTSRIASLEYHHINQVADNLKPRTPLDLIAKPANPHDKYTVRIQSKLVLIGYLPCTSNHVASRLLRQSCLPSPPKSPTSQNPIPNNSPSSPPSKPSPSTSSSSSSKNKPLKLSSPKKEPPHPLLLAQGILIHNTLQCSSYQNTASPPLKKPIILPAIQIPSDAHTAPLKSTTGWEPLFTPWQDHPRLEFRHLLP